MLPVLDAGEGLAFEDKGVAATGGQHTGRTLLPTQGAGAVFQGAAEGSSKGRSLIFGEDGMGGKAGDEIITASLHVVIPAG